ncbi:acyl carrier protein [Cellulomonas taurus]|uniref:acyl carrier protein n=1 Tax=Cellulomonas taurus TaxID=2729175 RepID=UPI00145F2F7F|nr:acyl carrier protein [Cellulomonas taurus]
MPTTTRESIDPQDGNAIRSVVVAYLSRYVDDEAVLHQDRLISAGWLDSLAAVGLIGHLERSFGLEVADEDLDIANFDSLAAITALVTRKLDR